MRPWLVIPVIGIASGAVAFLVQHSIELALALGLAGAALAAAIRALGGPSLAAALCAGAGGALGALGVLALAPVPLRAVVAGAAALFAICELARAKAPDASPWPAVGAALAAGVLDPAYVALIAVAGAHLVANPSPRPRWVIALPITGVLATALAVAGALRHHALFARWAGHLAPGSLATGHGADLALAAGHGHLALAARIAEIGELLGPLTATAAIAGLALCALRGRFAALAVWGVVAMTALVDLAGPALAPATPLVAALGAGVAIHRLATLIRWPAGQAFLGATAGFVLVVVPAWSLAAPG